MGHIDEEEIEYDECPCCHTEDGSCDCWGSICPKCGGCYLDCTCEDN